MVVGQRPRRMEPFAQPTATSPTQQIDDSMSTSATASASTSRAGGSSAGAALTGLGIRGVEPRFPQLTDDDNDDGNDHRRTLSSATNATAAAAAAAGGARTRDTTAATATTSAASACLTGASLSSSSSSSDEELFLTTPSVAIAMGHRERDARNRKMTMTTTTGGSVVGGAGSSSSNNDDDDGNRDIRMLSAENDDDDDDDDVLGKAEQINGAVGKQQQHGLQVLVQGTGSIGRASGSGRSVSVVEEEEEDDSDDDDDDEPLMIRSSKRSSLQVPSTPTTAGGSSFSSSSSRFTPSSPGGTRQWPASPNSPYLSFATASAGAWHGASIDQFRSSAAAAEEPPMMRSPLLPSGPLTMRFTNASSGMGEGERNGRDREEDDEGNGIVRRQQQPLSAATAAVAATGSPGRPTLIRTPPTDHDFRASRTSGGVDAGVRATQMEVDDAVSLFKKPFPPPNYAPPAPSPLKQGSSSMAAPSSHTHSRSYSRSHARQQSSISINGFNARGGGGGGGGAAPASPRFVLPPPSPSSRMRSPRSPQQQQHGRQSSLFDAFGNGEAGEEERMHARNLSAFFPDPSKQYTPEEVEIQKRHEATRRRAQQQQQAASAGGAGATAHKPGAANGWSFTRSKGKQAAQELTSNDTEIGLPKLMPPASPTPQLPNRRGYHHRHSLSHNFFNFLDPAAEDEAGGGTAAKRLDTPQPSSSPFINGAQTPRLDSSSSFPILPAPSVGRRVSETSTLASLSSSMYLSISLGLAEIGVGMALWMQGQKSSMLGLTGVGYLVVFDAIGLLLGVSDKIMAASSGGLSSARLPFGSVRRETIAYFVQIIFLFFTSVFISKEAVEHVLTSGEDHGHGHGHGLISQSENRYPTLLLAVATISSAISAVSLDNHAKLARISSTSGRLAENDVVRMALALVPSLRPLLENTFSSLVLGSTGVTLLAGHMMSTPDLLQFDRALSFVIAYVSFFLAKSAGTTLGKVLLQTAPPARSLQMSAMKDVINELTEHPAVTRIARSHVWQLTPHDPQDVHADRAPKPPATPILSRASSFVEDIRTGGLATPPSTPPRKSLRRRTSDDEIVDTRSSSCILVASLEVVVSDATEDATVFDLTRWAYERCSAALWCSRTDRGGSGRAGEVTVKVAREADYKHHQHDRSSAENHHHHHHQYHSHTHDHHHSHHHAHHHHH